MHEVIEPNLQQQAILRTYMMLGRALQEAAEKGYTQVSLLGLSVTGIGLAGKLLEVEGNFNGRMSTVPTPGVLVDADADAREVVLGRLAGAE